MKLYLVQHAEAKSKEEDPDRPLTEKGAKDAGRVADFLSRKGVQVNRALHSGKTRAQQTAEVLAGKIGAKVEQAEGLKPLDDAGVWVNRLEESDEDLMLVGHLPHMGRLCSRLLSRGEELKIGFRPGSVVCIQREEGEWSLGWMVTPDLV